MEDTNFTTSKTCTKVFKKMHLVKKELGSTVTPEGKNPHYGNDYIQLDTLTKKIDKETKKIGLLISHFPTGRGLVTLVVDTESGEFIQNSYELVLERETAQGIGSSLTYAKRQVLQSMFNLSAGEDEDDDGEAAEVSTPPKEKKLSKSEQIMKDIDEEKTLESLKLYYNTCPKTYRNSDAVKEKFKAKKAELEMLTA